MPYNQLEYRLIPLVKNGEGQRPSPDGGLKLNSSICLLRGLLHLRLSSMQQAKECFVEALTLDVKNYDAYRELIEGGMMTATEGASAPQDLVRARLISFAEWEFVQTLAYNRQLSEEEAHFVKLMYTTKVRKVGCLRSRGRLR